MAKKRIVMALGHDALGTNLPEQKKSVAATAKLIADFIQNGWQVAVVHSNAPQVGMIHTAMMNFVPTTRARATPLLPCPSARL